MVSLKERLAETPPATRISLAPNASAALIVLPTNTSTTACQDNRRVVLVNAPRMLNDLHGAELHGGLERALRRYVRAELLVIDDFAVLAMDPAQAKLAFQVISERYEYRRSTGITTNRPFRDWPKVFPDALNAQVIAERLTERSEHFVLNNKGYRTKR